MTDKNHSGFGSRIVLGTLKSSSNSDDEDIFLSESIADRPELRVQVRYFTVELKPSRCSNQKNFKKKESKNIGNKNCSRNGQKKDELVKKISSTEATSCESFYSCRSSTSVQELQPKAYNSNISKKECLVRPESIKGKVIRDDDLLNHLTMVNAIFLSKSVSDSTKQKEIDQEREANINRPNTCKNDSLNVSRMPSAPHKVCSQAFACQINHNPRIKYISTISGNNIITKPIMGNFDILDGKIGGGLSYTKTFSESFEPVFNSKSSFETFENLESYKQTDLGTRQRKDTPDTFTFPKGVLSSSASLTKRLEVRLPELKFAEIVPLCDDSSLPVVFSKVYTDSKYETLIKRRKGIMGCEDKATKYISSNISLVRKTNVLDTGDIFNGHGDFSATDDIVNNEKRVNNQFFGDLNESYLNMLISKSLKKLKNESVTNIKPYTNYESDESDIFESDEEHEDFQTNTRKPVDHMYTNCTNVSNFQTNTRKPFDYMYTNFTNVSLNYEKFGLKSSNGFRDQKNGNQNSTVEDSQSSPTVEECDSDMDCEDQDSELNPRNITSSTSQIGNGFCKRGTCERTRTLPVIQEESSQESIDDTEDLPEDSLADDYCLIDSNGRPIHLFDCQGLPLTDNSGRPLRSAKGKLLMNCDQNGIPVVDSDCGIFDMFGRQPHEDRFDPSMAPKMALCSKLSAGDGRPLLLFDALGRPLTSVSGTMLVDSSGRGLVRLSTTDKYGSNA